MKKLFTFLLLFGLTLGLSAQRGTGLSSSPNVSATTEAKNFGLTIVKAYIENNCGYVYSKLASEITLSSNGLRIQKSTISQSQFCQENPVMSDLGSKYTDYVASYNPEVLDCRAFSAKYPQAQAIQKLRDGDFYFDGAVLKPGGSSIFWNESAVRFTVRKNARGQFEITKL